MTSPVGTLHGFCGKIASGKSSLAASLAREPGSLLIGEDQLLSTLYPGEIASLEDYARCAKRLRTAIAPLLEELLRSGVTIVLDFQANTPAARAWLRSVAERAGAPLRLHYLEASDALCLTRLARRNAAGEHHYQASEDEFAAFTRHFTAPQPSEGIEILLHKQV